MKENKKILHIRIQLKEMWNIMKDLATTKRRIKDIRRNFFQTAHQLQKIKATGMKISLMATILFVIVLVTKLFNVETITKRDQ